MATLKGLMGLAHVEFEEDGTSWTGYILIQPNLENTQSLQGQPLNSPVLYNGPLCSMGTYYWVSGKVQIVKLLRTPGDLKVEFRGADRPTAMVALQAKPADYID